VTGRSFEHRKQWVEDKLYELAGRFAMDLCAYAVMSNHYHVVLHVDKDRAESWSRAEVIERWQRLFRGSPLSQRYLSGESLQPAEQRLLTQQVEVWRQRLMSVSWFMRVLNESIARQANKEDRCTGRFWEGRFKSQALLDEPALAACLAYVDLNPVRAGIAKTPEKSNHTSIRQRSIQASKRYSPNHPQQQVKGLMPFAGNPRAAMPKGLPFRLTDYLELVDWTGRIMREDKRGSIDSELPGILDRLNMDPRQWLYLSKRSINPI
jgi:REP element-mobilizing transposase RayT